MEPSFKYILHVDDDEEDYFMLHEAIKEVSDIIEVGFIKEFPDNLDNLLQSRPDLIFLDINMPAHDGFYWLKEMAKHSSFTMPVIMYSTASTDHYIAQAYEAGAHLFFVKPPTFSQLVESIRHILQMNWHDPESIREQHYQDGVPRSFQLQTLV
jgi:DNA-binding NtrC family response regulator